VVIDFDMRFSSLVWMLIKFEFASLVAMLIILLPFLLLIGLASLLAPGR
jgi:hypothetical protein